MRLNSAIRLLLICHLSISAVLFTGASSSFRISTLALAPSQWTPSIPLPSTLLITSPTLGQSSLTATVDMARLASPQKLLGSVTPLLSFMPQTSNPVSSPSIADPTNSLASKTFLSSSSSVNSSFGFNGLDQVQSCNCAPPDVQVAAGPNHLVEMVNLETEMFSKQGSPLKTASLSSFFNTGSDSISDPKVLFDAPNGRWFASITDITALDVVLAVSTSSDPTSTWKIYTLGTGGRCADQPIIGLDNSTFVASANDFTSCSRSGRFVGAQYWVLNKSEMVAGASTIDFATFGPNSSLFSVHPVQALSLTSTEYMVSTGTGSGVSSVQLFSITGVPPATVTVSVKSLSIPTISLPPGGVQPGTNSLVNTDDARVEDSVWFQGTLWFGLNDACTPTGDTQTRSCIRLAQIDTSSSVVTQDFDYGASGQYYYYPALRIDGSGNLDIIYGHSSSTVFPSLAITGQATGDPLNTLSASKTIKVGSADETTGRYGDYFGAGLDPSNSSQVWVAGEYVSTSGGVWSTFIASVKIVSNRFTISSAPQIQVLTPGSTGKSNITLTSLGNFAGAVGLTATVSPNVSNGPTDVLNPISVTLTAGGSSNSTLTISTTTATPPGNYSITVTGSSGTVSHSVVVSVQIFDFSISNSGAITIVQGSSGSNTISITLLGGPSSSVDLSCTGGLPSGALCSFSPNPGLPTFTSTLTISTSPSAATGSYTILVSGTGGGETHSTQFILTIVAPQPAPPSGGGGNRLLI
jgi:hypothetical protein